MIRFAITLAIAWSFAVTADPLVKTARVPDGGLQPQLAVDATGDVHLVYFKGEPAHGDLFYARSPDGGATFSRPIRVNSQPGSAIAVGTIRGAQVALGRGGRVHVAWNGSGVAEPKGPGGANPMLYARLDHAGDAFEPQRNVITQRYGLDGGGSIAADPRGNVYVAWHAPERVGAGEANRRVWVARSSDDGKTFAPEAPATTDATGACGCCGMKIFADPRGDGVFALYRSATEMVHRDIYLLRSDDGCKRFAAGRIAPMEVGMCIMSSAALASGGEGRVLAAWETRGEVYWAAVEQNGASVGRPVAATGTGKNRKYPALAVNASGQVLMAWAEGTSWNRGGSVAWQVYDAGGKPIAESKGQADGLPAWSLPAAYAVKDGTFIVLY